MFFVLSKLLLFLLTPFYWIVFTAVMAFKTKSVGCKKRWWLLTAIIFFLFSNYRIYSWCLLAWQPQAVPQKHQQNYQTGIILCGMSTSDKRGNGYFRPGADRFIQTCKLYHTGVIKKIFISGGDGSLLQNRPVKEADFLYQEFKAQGIPDSVLIIEKHSKNTYESAIAAKHFIDSLQLQTPVVLITSAIHMKRSIATFNKAGIQVIAHAAGFEVVNSHVQWYSYFVPDIGVLSSWKELLKEMVGYCVYKVTNKA